MEKKSWKTKGMSRRYSGGFEYIKAFRCSRISHIPPSPSTTNSNSLIPRILLKFNPSKPINMQFSILSFALIASAALSAAAPKKGPPGPPSGTYGGVSQSCSASQSSIHCCQANGNKNGDKKNVYYPDGNAQLVCSQITGK